MKERKEFGVPPSGGRHPMQNLPPEGGTPKLLFVPESFDGVESRGFSRGPHSENKTDGD